MTDRTNCAIVAASTYRLMHGSTDSGFLIVMAVARTAGGYALTIGDAVSVRFKTLDEMYAMLPPFAAEGESGYEDARASLIAQFALAVW